MRKIRRDVNTRIDFALLDVSRKHRQSMNDKGVNIGLLEAQRQMAEFIQRSGFMKPKIIRKPAKQKKDRKTFLEVRF